MYLICTTSPPRAPASAAADLATAGIIAEAFGGLVGRAAEEPQVRSATEAAVAQ